MVKKLHVYANEVTDWVIAESPKDAIKVWEEFTGEKYIIDEYGGKFIREKDNEKLTFIEEETCLPQPCPAGGIIISTEEFQQTSVKATCRAWADARGRCFLGSTEY
jgi:hypothetical protein